MFHFFALLFFVTCQASTIPQNCISNTNIRLNCTIEAGRAEVQCPKANVIRIIGDYQNVSIHCVCDDHLQFSYSGTKPTEAIRVNSWRDVTLVNMTTENPTVLRQHIKVEVLSVLSLIEEYKKTMRIESFNLSTSTQLFYSRSGEFRFDVISELDGAYSLSFLIFFEEPKVDPGFINRYELNEGLKVTAKDKYFVGCRSTHYVQPDGWGQPELWIQGDKRRQNKADYDPTAGFHVNSSWTEIEKITSRPTTFLCIIPHKTNLSKTIRFDPTLTLPAYELSVKKLSSEKTSVEAHLWSYFSSGGNFNARCTPTDPTLYFIGARNPEEQVLVRDFVLPDLVSRSLYVEKGMPSKYTAQFSGGVETHRGTPLHFGALYCIGGPGYNLRSFVTDIKGLSSFLGLSHSVDWRIIQGKEKDTSWPEDKLPSNASAELYLELDDTYNGKTVYDCDILKFRCHVHPFFTRPVVWQINQNGTTIHEVEKDVTVDPSIFTTQLKAGFANISCLASIWAWRKNWAQLTVNVTVIESKVPKFEESQQVIYEFAPDTEEPQVKVMADGVPNPEITCSADSSDAGQAPVTVAKVYQRNNPKDVTESTFRIEDLRETVLTCDAKNARGVASITIKINVKTPIMQIITISVSSSIAALLVLIIISFAMFTCIRRRRSYLRRMAIYRLIQNIGDDDSDEEDFHDEEDFPHLHPFDYDYEIDKTSFTFDESKCLAKTPVKYIYPGWINKDAVVVKTTLKNAERSSTYALLNEYKIQIYLGYHPNLVQLLGASTSYELHGRVFILEEFCEIGTLRDFLRCNLGSFEPDLGKVESLKRRPRNTALSVTDLFDWSIQIVGAMEYLSQKGIIHRDLCTKNILMQSTHTVKVGGLEYARRLYAYPEYSDPRVGSTLSWRWMAIESIRDRVFSIKSDVWSMGVTLWEIFSYAEVPYGNKAKNMVMVYQLENGLRLEKPKCAPEFMYQKLLLHCWNANPDCRPNFAIIKELLKTFVKVPASSSRPGSIAYRMSALMARV